MTDNNADETAANSKLSRRTALALMGTSAVGGAATSSAYSKLTADRPIDVKVSSNGAAETSDSGSSELLITNNDDSQINAEVSTADTNVTLVTSDINVSGSNPWTVESIPSNGGTATVEFSHDNSQTDVDFDVTAFSGTSGFSINTVQTVTVAQGLTAYFEDDWGDSTLTGRTGTDTGAYNDANAVYRPEWTVETGLSASNQSLDIEAGDSAMYADIDLNLNDKVVWEWTGIDLSVMDTNNGDEVGFGLFAEQTQNRTTSGWANAYEESYFVFIRPEDIRFVIRKVDDTVSEVLTTSANYTQNNTIRVERDSSGTWEVFFDGTSLGTYTDTTYTNPQATYFSSRDGLGDVVTVDTMRVD